MSDYELLDWDSEFFGFRVGKIIPATLDRTRLEAILGSLRRDEVSLAYWAADSESVGSKAAAIALGGRLVDRKVTYFCDLETLDHESFEHSKLIEEFDGQAADETLEQLAIQSGEWSRFRRDPRIPTERFEELFRSWIRRSVTREIAAAVLVIRGDDRQVTGMVTLGEKNGRGDIGLIAVGASSRGRGYGRLLVNAALKYFWSHGYRHCQVVTQADNEPACRLYETAGYKPETCENFFHFWLD